ncbi:MAG: type II CAAX endopeptidase family protein [Thermodesulfovibrionia bacterium]|nr:type II CAAX endopeptidase family protein [Thermodesulfovibrionia bacterium]
MIEDVAKRKTPLYIMAFFLLVSPFYLNDFASIFVKDWHLWLFIDYAGVKLFPFLVTLWLISKKKMRASEFGLTTQSVPSFLIAFLIVALVGTVIDQNGYQLIANLPGYSPLGGMPAITNPAWDWIDLTLGLLMVGIFEELIFRGFMHTFISRYTENPFAIVVISSAAFGLIHWSLGLHAIVITSIIGAVFMTAYLRTRSLPAIMLAHFAINFIDFAGVIPKAVFKFI